MVATCTERPVRGRCAHCGAVSRPGRRHCSTDCARAWATDHVWGHARRVALARAGYECEECGADDWTTVLQVHHIVPVDPRTGYRTGCAHHQDNLAVLCELHHRQIHQALRTPPGAQLSLVLAAA